MSIVHRVNKRAVSVSASIRENVVTHLSPEVHTKFVALCEASGMTRAAMMRRLIERFCQEER
jgi:predicted DNA-binding protein